MSPAAMGHTRAVPRSRAVTGGSAASFPALAQELAKGTSRRVWVDKVCAPDVD